MGDFYEVSLEAYVMLLSKFHSQESSFSKALPTSNWLGNSAYQNTPEEKEIKWTIISAIILLCEQNLFYLIPSL